MRALVVLGLGFATDAAAQTCGGPFPIDCNEGWEVTTGDCVSHEGSYTCGGGAYSGADHVWEFTPPAGQRFYFDVKPYNNFLGSNDLDLFLQDSSTCGAAGNCLASETQAGNDSLMWTADGSTYRMSLDKISSLFGGACIDDYIVLLGCPQPCDPATDVVQVLTCSSDLLNQTTADGTDVMDYFACGTPNPNNLQTNPEDVYEFTPQASGSVTFVLSNLSTDHDIYVLPDVCDEAACLVSSTEAFTATDFVTFYADAGRTYYIVVEAFGGVGTYDLSFQNSAGCPEDCDNGLDDDVDGDIDCDDTDCTGDPVCCGDNDADGHDADTCGGDDCDDTLAGVNPSASELECNGLDDDCDAGTADATDDDGDGVDGCSDCDDADVANFPGNAEVCDGLDNDCDGAPDNGLTTTSYWPDADGDGHGDSSVPPVSTCDGPPAGNYVTVGDDCDDTDPLNFPGNVEVCDGADNDCDSTADDGLTFDTWYEDADNDTYGDAGDSVSTCDGAPAGHVADATDCDDTDPAVNPGAAELTCDGLDNDCDAGTEDAPDGDGDGASLCVDCDDADGAIHPSAPEVTCDGLDNDCDAGTLDAPDGDSDGTDVCSDCDDTDPAVNPGASEVTCDGLDNDCDAGTLDGPDGDGDGADLCTDCDDADADNFPTNTEVCDGADNDCDGTADDSLTFVDYYNDGDGDSYGAGLPTSTCDGAPAGTVADGTDCDDGNAAVNPGATEVTCDGLDNDCDGATEDAPDGDGDGADVCTDCDDGDAGNFPGNAEVCDGADNDCDGAADNGVSFSDFYPDGDGDGFGDGLAAPVSTCDGAPGGHVADTTDCDDGDGSIHPGANEITADGIDQDCDGFDVCYTDGDGDGVGTPAVVDGATLDCTGAGESVRDDDCDDADPNNFPGNAELCDGFDNDCDGQVDETATIVDYWPDLDGDGYGDGSQAPTSTCAAPPPGVVADDTDCDDNNAAIHPNAAETTCNGLDDDCDVGTVDEPDVDGDGDTVCVDCDDADPALSYQDVDGDGIASCDADCDDSDANRYPGAPEVADGIDQDCDGAVDEGTIWTDDDGDGYAEEGGDCDDGDAAIHPNAAEACDSVDQDCDGTIDEGTDCYDDDGDGATEQQGDCNDGDAAVHPGAVEVPANGLDDDCDGVTDDGAVDMDADGWTTAAGDCDDADPGAHPGAVEVCDGVDQDCDGTADNDTSCYDDDGDGVTEDEGDCDDADDQVHPGAVEVANGIDDDCDGATDEDTEVSDDDGDGISEIAGDCDDSDDQVHPGAPERPNGVDDDCDDETDEGIGDADGDGFTVEAGDCDDTSGWVHPGAPEVCDRVDNDCNAKIDEGCLEETETPLQETGSCGCDSSPSPWAAWPAGLLLLGLRRRR